MINIKYDVCRFLDPALKNDPKFQHNKKLKSVCSTNTECPIKIFLIAWYTQKQIIGFEHPVLSEIEIEVQNMICTSCPFYISI